MKLITSILKGMIEVATCLYEGRTLDDSFNILDEAQNTTRTDEDVLTQLVLAQSN